MLVTTILGARPQFVKAAVVSRALIKSGRFRESIVHTGQHYDPNLSDVFFEELDIPLPSHNLGVGSGTHALQTSRMLEGIESILMAERPDCVLVYGDTNSTLAGALAAVKMHIPVAHVEAGLRSYNRKMPEEINRVVTDHVSDLLLAPTDEALKNLLTEGVSPSAICKTGDVMYDASLFYAKVAMGRSRILEKLGLSKQPYILATIHRAENTSDARRLAVIVQSLAEVSVGYPVVWPIHPRTREALYRFGLISALGDSVKITEPVGYLDMVTLESNSALIVTDSGGVQKEAFFFRVPCVTLRDETEWVELMELGWNTTVTPSSTQDVTRVIMGAIGTCGREGVPYGDGHAGERVVEALWRKYGCGS